MTVQSHCTEPMSEIEKPGVDFLHRSESYAARATKLLERSIIIEEENPSENMQRARLDSKVDIIDNFISYCTPSGIVLDIFVYNNLIKYYIKNSIM